MKKPEGEDFLFNSEGDPPVRHLGPHIAYRLNNSIFTFVNTFTICYLPVPGHRTMHDISKFKIFSRNTTHGT